MYMLHLCVVQRLVAMPGLAEPRPFHPHPHPLSPSPSLPPGSCRVPLGLPNPRYLKCTVCSKHVVSSRQRTIRELQVGQTLFKDEQGRWVIRHGPGHYKTGKAYGERPPMVIAPHIYPELEAFLEAWRAELNPKHDLVFCQADGDPLTSQSVYKLFTTSCFRYSSGLLFRGA